MTRAGIADSGPRHFDRKQNSNESQFQNFARPQPLQCEAGVIV